MRYLVKGRDFCIDLCVIIDILSEFMKMMVSVQAISQLLWTITKYWPRVRNRILKQKGELLKQKEDMEHVLSKDLFPKLGKHFPDLNKEDAHDCTFHNVKLTPGWIIVDERDIDIPDDSLHVNKRKKKKQKEYDWVDRSPTDCLEDLENFCTILLSNMDSRYKQSVTPAAHTLGACIYIPDIYEKVQGSSSELTSEQIASLQEYGQSEFTELFQYICTLSHSCMAQSRQCACNMVSTY